jgi:hypothetical protein
LASLGEVVEAARQIDVGVGGFGVDVEAPRDPVCQVAASVPGGELAAVGFGDQSYLAGGGPGAEDFEAGQLRLEFVGGDGVDVHTCKLPRWCDTFRSFRRVDKKKNCGYVPPEGNVRCPLPHRLR